MFDRFAGPRAMLLVSCLVLGLAGCQQTTGGTAPAQPVAARTEPAPLPPLKGPKRTVAVGNFDAIGGFVQRYGDWDVGGGLAAMLTTALVQSDRFVVLERAELKEVLAEQKLKTTKIVNPETGPKLGKLAGVQLFIHGAVTEFGENDEGGGVSAGFFRGRIPLSLGAGLQTSSGSVAMDVRVVDATTGEVIESHRVSENLESTGFSLRAGYKGISIGSNDFKRTPLGKASRAAIDQAVRAIIGTASSKPWTGQVVEVDGQDVIINAGGDAGIQKGDVFQIERVVKTLTDPSTGQVLGTRRREISLLTIKGVEPRLAYGPMTTVSGEAPKRGDLVIQLGD